MIGVEIQVPAAGKSFDIYVPEGIRVHEMKQLVCRLLQPMVREWIMFDDETMLCQAESGVVLNENHSVEVAGVEVGAILLLL